MALVRGFKPCWFIPEGMEDFAFHRGVSERSHEREHERVHAPNGSKRAYARILSVDEENETAEVQWLDRYGVDTDEVPLDSCVALTFQEYDVGTRVLVKEASQENAKGSKGTVEETFSGLHLIRFEGRDEDDPARLYDWLPYGRLQPIH